MSDNKGRDWKIAAGALEVSGDPYIDGAVRPCLDAARLHTVYPADGTRGFTYAACSEAEVDLAVEAARRAWKDGWRDLGPSRRRELLLGLADAVLQNAEQLTLCDVLDVGKPVSAAMGEAFPAAGFIRYYAEAIDKVFSGNVAPTGPDAMELQVWRPRGVVGAITPWNFPLINACFKLGPALAAGNTVVIKPSELSPRSTLLLAKIAGEAGIPPGVINVVTGAAETGRALVRHPGVDMVTFTGSTATGKAVLSDIGRSSIKPVLLECGGKSPEIVFDDAAEFGLPAVAAQVARGALWNQGQVCVARSRILVQRGIYEDFLAALTEVAASIRPGDPLEESTQFGPLASAAQCEKVNQFIASGAAQGARLLLDGRDPGGVPPGSYVGPTVFADVPWDSDIFRDEIFGPVLCVVPFEDEAQAIELANDTDYGLAATVWTRDLSRAHRMARGILAGKIRIVASPQQVEGAGFCHSAEPAGQSGYGVEGGPNGLRSYMRQQSVEFCMG
jgi:gamma-glutamyl-gamma-aminobutyraldehyde dehydrogenase